MASSRELTECGAHLPEAEARLKELMLLSLGGDAVAYRTLLSALSVRLRSYYGRRLERSSADMEDLVQETLIALHERRMSFDRTQPLTAWVHAIARYKLIDHIRRKAIRLSVDVDDCEELFAADDIEQAAASRDVDRMLAILPAATAEAIRLTRIEGHSVQETADRMGKSVTATKVSIHRGLLRLVQRRGAKLDEDG